ncbi:hypothetical protein EDD37DRAFT_613585 [Exophiala viscosa]|uniref:uncharacterized protein n=1 Tax=Exophiala viscosa TaxID=2486360 RepID=UPI002196BDD5|nr:hypothetical protein EDD37DRAFT_613585 [Exophiala viscosa]
MPSRNRPQPSPPMTSTENWIPVPDDLLSEESDFQGNAETKAFYNKLAKSYNPRNYWAIHDWSIQVIAESNREVQKRIAEPKAGEKVATPSKRRKLDEASDKQQQATHQSAKPELKPLRQSGGKLLPDNTPTQKASGDETNAGNERDKLKPRNFYEGQKSAKQLSESLSEFLERLPPSTTPFSTCGPWIWIANPYPPEEKNAAGKIVTDPEGRDIASFRQLGTRLLENYMARKEELEAQNPDKQPGSITRMLRPDRVRLESSIRELARQKNVTCGKWMLFPEAGDVDFVWAVVAKGVWEGKLGISAKVATAPDAGPTSDEGDERARGREQRLICVYTYDFSDKDDVKRVLLGLKQLGLLNNDSFENGPRSHSGSADKVIYYKCDAYTYLDISSHNEYKLKASMYSSKDMLAEKD